MDDPIPDGAETASPIYLLTPAEYARQQALENPYAVKDSTCIASALQDQCENDKRVLYPIHVESDAYLDEGPKALIDWFRRFVEDVLAISFDECTLYYSGKRSIHVHAPRFVTSEGDRERLKERAERFCDEMGADLDLGLYDRKRQFRLPGVVHADTNLAKVRINPQCNHEQIIRAAAKPVAGPLTYAEVVEEVFGKPSAEMIEAARDGDELVVWAAASESQIEPPAIERDVPPSSPTAYKKWQAYNHKEFSPYANASAKNGRSVAAIQVLGGAYQREEVGRKRILVPAYFYGAHGCNGRKFTKHQEHAPLQLSKPDYAKWELGGYSAGECVVIIGGQSRQSRIFRVDEGVAQSVGDLLDPEDGSRDGALAFLELLGFDVGGSGASGGQSQRRVETRGLFDRVLPATSPQSRAAELQRRVEQSGVKSLENENHEMSLIAIRLLQKYGWGPTWRWFEEQYGDDFKPGLAYKKLKHIAEYYDDLSHVEVPSPP